MDSQTEKAVVSDVVKYMADPNYCMKTVTMLQDAGATADLAVGTVLEASSTKYVAMTTGSSAAAVLMTFITMEDIIAGDVTANALVRGPAVLDYGKMTFRGTAQETDAKAALLVLHILTQEEPDNREEGLDS
jgi:hypothetical protein